MDDGLGFSIGALFGGFLYQEIGGMKSFRVFAAIALITCIAHSVLRPSTHEFQSTVAPISGVAVTAKPHKQKKEVTLEEKKLTDG